MVFVSDSARVRNGIEVSGHVIAVILRTNGKFLLTYRVPKQDDVSQRDGRMDLLRDRVKLHTRRSRKLAAGNSRAPVMAIYIRPRNTNSRQTGVTSQESAHRKSGALAMSHSPELMPDIATSQAVVESVASSPPRPSRSGDAPLSIWPRKSKQP